MESPLPGTIVPLGILLINTPNMYNDPLGIKLIPSIKFYIYFQIFIDSKDTKTM